MSMRVSVVALCVIVAMVCHGEVYKAPVVMITSTYEGDTLRQERQENGAGIIFASYSNRVYVVTARHILFESGGMADQVAVEFSMFPKEPVEGEIYDVSQQHDVAVLLVELNDEGMFQTVSEIELSGFAPADALQEGDEVYKLGFPDGKKWDYLSVADTVKNTLGLFGVETPSKASIVVSSQTTKYGHSGGVFLDSIGRYVGMIHWSYDSDTVATPMEVVAEILRYANYVPRWHFEESSGVNELEVEATVSDSVDYSLDDLEFMHQEALSTVTTVAGSETYNSTIFRIFYHENGPNIRDVSIEIIPGIYPTFPQPRWIEGAFFTRVAPCVKVEGADIPRIHCEYIGGGGVIGFALRTKEDERFAGGTVVVSNADGVVRYEFE